MLKHTETFIYEDKLTRSKDIYEISEHNLDKI